MYLMHRCSMIPRLFIILSILAPIIVHCHADLEQCGDGTTLCQTSPFIATSLCCEAKHSPSGYGCRLNTTSSDNGLSSPCCMPGPELPPSSTIPNCLILGDSVSIGYTPTVVAHLQRHQSVCKVQHGPWDVTNGGAGSTAEGLACLENFLVTQAQTPVSWDAILFNFGLHNLHESSEAKEEYRRELAQITRRLAATGATLLYALTTPFMPKTSKGVMLVDELNDIAMDVMAPYGNISIVDLNGLVHGHCGKSYSECDWCSERQCSFHYSGIGKVAQGQMVAEAFQNALESTNNFAN